METDVLVVGAGPTGLVLALSLARQGAKVRVVDRAEGPGTTSRALAVQARTLELYRQLGLTDEIVAEGHHTPAVNLWVRGSRAAGISLAQMGEGLTPYPFLHIFPQDRHERLLEERLEAEGVRVERRTEVMSVDDHGDRIVARLADAGGAERIAESSWIAGCDGARSIVRHAIGASFQGGTYRQLFYVADADISGPTANGELHIDLDEADFLAVFPIDGAGRVRLIGTVRDDRATHPETLCFNDVGQRAIEHLKVEVRNINWFSTYHVHHRVTDRFRRGRAFLLGDAAHIHSPAGGQGMNTGIGDAINLAWKLAEVIHGRAPERILDSYEAERIGFARRLVQTTDRVFSFATAEGLLADVLRTRLAPIVAPMVTASERAREYAFRTISQITLNYRGGPLSRGEAGKVRGGDRLPWAPVDGGDNYRGLEYVGWQVHVYGSPAVGLPAWCETRKIPLHIFEWTNAYGAAGLARDALYLLRPDTYVGLADPSGSVAAVDAYCNDLGLILG
ncbi:MAG TPA: FAD-dependent oxidoreductase, partial [Caulobacteraceae bacterium]|jgi:2-polyprenyl-6-methoxyphenol hydroxylase-like FAD-dependent oxidoreductase|nr:FAD-dependent oxidoreductase [Caulobacteraceae bacterium]